MQASYLFNESIHDNYIKTELEPVEYRKKQVARNKHYGYYYDFHAGRKCVEWFTEVGLRYLDIRVKAENVQHPGSQYMKLAIKEAEEWYAHPHAFNFWTLVFTAGMVG